MEIIKNVNTNKEQYDIMYVCADLKRVGPSNQTLSIIKGASKEYASIVVTLFKEPKDTMIDEYIKSNIEVVCLNRKAFILNGKRILKNIMNKLKIKIVHSYGIKPDYICQKATKETDIQHIITLRNFPKEDIFTRMNKLNAILAYRMHIKTLLKAKNIVACSKTIENKMKNKYKQDNIISIQNGVDIYKFKEVDKEEKERLRKKYGIETDKKVFISTSSFIPRKRIEETILAFNKVKLANKQLLLLGTGSKYEKIYAKYKKEKDIKFIGKTDNVVEYLQMSDIFVTSSQSEGLPNGVIEAAACGLPVIMSDIGQHKEILEEIKEIGMTYKLGNLDDFSHKLQIVEKKDYRSSLINSNLTMSNMARKYVEYYKEILNGR